MSTPDEKLVQNLEKQLERLVEQINDLEECKNEISKEEYDFIYDDTREQIQEFEASLEKLQSGNITLNSKFSLMRAAIRNAISKSFNTNDLKQSFDVSNDLDEKLKRLEEDFRLKRIEEAIFCNSKVCILEEMQALGLPLSIDHSEFLQKHHENRDFNTLQKMEHL